MSLARSVALQDAQPQLRQFLLLTVLSRLVVLDNLVDDVPRTRVLRLALADIGGIGLGIGIVWHIVT